MIQKWIQPVSWFSMSFRHLHGGIRLQIHETGQDYDLGIGFVLPICGATLIMGMFAIGFLTTAGGTAKVLLARLFRKCRSNTDNKAL